jgi:hypothetical protein
MKRYILSILLLSGMLVAHAAIFDTPAFKMLHTPVVELSKLHHNTTISTDTSLLLDLNTQISGMAISGRTILDNKDALVRVLLVDKNGKEYLVFEDTYLFPDDKDHEFSDVAMETAILENVNPKEVKVFVQNAQIEIYRITGVLSDNKLSSVELNKLRKDALDAQEEYLIDRWNRLNVQTGQFWVAGKTSISSLGYTDKKIALGATSDHYLSDGFEYYVGGFFIVKAHGDTATIGRGSQNDDFEIRDANVTYTEKFDWRNRHGKNWMTSVKHQAIPNNWVSGNGGCWIFGALAALESHVNLYYNRLLDLDLSEQEIGSCVVADIHGHPSLHSGGFPKDAYEYILHYGVVNESCFSFQNDSTIPCDEKCDDPDYIVNISNYSTASNNANFLKNELIHNGPIASGIYNRGGGIAHVMCLCGYGTIHAGDSLEYVDHNHNDYIDTVIPDNSPLVGQTYWIYKNSGGITNHHDGYVYVIYERESYRNYTTTLSYPVSLSTLTSNDIVCEDADNDGYYFWGLGSKPDNCPICCPDTPDGDDSNPELAEMDTYGNFAPYTFPYSTTTISSNTTWNSDTIHCGNIIVTNNATLTITAQLTMNPAAKIIVQDEGTLIVDTGSIVNANIDVQASAKFQLLHNGKLYLKQFGNLRVELGAEANMEYGRVLLQ